MSAPLSLEESRTHTSLSELLKLLLDIGADIPVFTTPSFQSWLGPSPAADWPPGSGAGTGLWLVDTRDEIARRSLRVLSAATDALPCDAAVILTGIGRPGNALRRLLRRVRRPGTRRLPPNAVFPPSSIGDSSTCVHRLAFDDGPFVPADFSMRCVPDSTGTAFLLSRRPAFQGPLWSLIADHLGSGPVEVESFQLRIRGAVVVMVRAGEHRFVIRIVPPGSLQPVVRRNHNVLLEIRASLRGEEQLLRLMPAPVFSAAFDGVAVFGETLLSGDLAWQVVSGTLAPIVYRNALQFLDALRAATVQTVRLHREQLSELVEDERRLIADSPFVSTTIRHALTKEIDSASAQLEGTDLPLYASHGDFGYGNVLVNAGSGRIEGVIDWDTARLVDFPGVDRVNLEIQIRRRRESFDHAVASTWQQRSAHEALHLETGTGTARALFALAVCRYVCRSFRYPAVYARQEAGFERALQWLARTGP